MIFKSNISLIAKFFNNLVNFIRIGHIWAIFAHDPGNNLHMRLRNIWVLLQNFNISLNGAFSKLFTIFLLLIFSNTRDKFVCQILCNQITSHLKNLVHGPNIPTMTRSKLFSKFIDLHHQVFSRRRLDWCSFQIV